MDKQLLIQSESANVPRAHAHDVEEGGCSVHLLPDETVLLTGTFNATSVSYQAALCTIIILATTCLAGLPFLLCMPCLLFGLRKSYQSMRLTLTDKTLTFEKGNFACCCVCWSQTERIVPLEKITDVTWVQGCLMRHYGIDSLRIRTASGAVGGDGAAADIHLTGLNNAKEFRTAIMRAKDMRDIAIGGRATPAPDMARPCSAADPGSADMVRSLASIAATVERLCQFAEQSQKLQQAEAGRSAEPPAL